MYKFTCQVKKRNNIRENNQEHQRTAEALETFINITRLRKERRFINCLLKYNSDTKKKNKQTKNKSHLHIQCITVPPLKIAIMKKRVSVS